MALEPLLDCKLVLSWENGVYHVLSRIHRHYQGLIIITELYQELLDITRNNKVLPGITRHFQASTGINRGYQVSTTGFARFFWYYSDCRILLALAHFWCKLIGFLFKLTGFRCKMTHFWNELTCFCNVGNRVNPDGNWGMKEEEGEKNTLFKNSE